MVGSRLPDIDGVCAAVERWRALLSDPKLRKSQREKERGR